MVVLDIKVNHINFGVIICELCDSFVLFIVIVVFSTTSGIRVRVNI